MLPWRERSQKLGRGFGHLAHGPFECGLRALRCRLHAADLPDVLAGRRLYFFGGGDGLEAPEGGDIAAHATQIRALARQHPSRQEGLPGLAEPPHALGGESGRRGGLDVHGVVVQEEDVVG